MTENRLLRRIDITSADEMYEKCLSASDTADIIIMAAAVADFKPSSVSASKIKKSNSRLNIELIPTHDILAELGKIKKTGQILVGFALETDQEEDNTRKKLEGKNLDMVVLNSLRDIGAGFKSPTNKISVLFKSGDFQRFPLKPKKEVAIDIIDCIESII